MRPTDFTSIALLLLSTTTRSTHAQDLPSLISLLLGGSTVSPKPGVNRSAFSTCTDIVSLVASDISLHLIEPTFAPTDVEGVAWGVCTLGGCTSIGLSRMDKCCSVAIADYNNQLTNIGSPYPISADQCFSRAAGLAAGAGSSQPASAAASATVTSSSSGSAAATSASDTETSGTAAASTAMSGEPGTTAISGMPGITATTPTAPPSAASAASGPSPSSSAPAKNAAVNQNADVVVGSLLALAVGIAGLAL